ncbi:hypothetical protein LTR66_001379 [Elasticomyces elasticus]|nr:hypothetical protein LTR66_001379 [Elasticomyces elasticus]
MPGRVESHPRSVAATLIFPEIDKDGARKSTTVSTDTSDDDKTGTESEVPKHTTSEPAVMLLQDPTNATPGALLDVDVEALITQLCGARMSDAQNAAPVLYVPRDYSMQMNNDLQSYQADIKRLKEREKIRRKMGCSPSVSRRKRVKNGFDPARVIRKHAISLHKDVPKQCSTLTNAVHPMFSHDNFRDTPMEIYEVLKPALRLATNLLLHRANSVFWHTLAFGNREFCEKATAKAGFPCRRIRDDVLWSADNAVRYDKYLDEIANHIKICFDFIPPQSQTYGFFYTACDLWRRLLPLDRHACCRSKIGLHTDFYTTAKRLSLLKEHADPAMVLRFNCFLAINITHEVAHFLEMAHNYPWGEVYMNDNMYAESGIAFEMKVFGGRVHPISYRIDCAYGLATFDWPPKEIDDTEDNIFYTVPMEYIVKLQQQETWDKDPNDMSETDLHIPRNGARSVGINAFNMTISEDEAEVQILDELGQGIDAPLKRTVGGRIVKSGVHRPPSKLIYGSMSTRLVSSRRKKSKRKERKGRKTEVQETVERKEESVVEPRRGKVEPKPTHASSVADTRAGDCSSRSSETTE